MHLELALKTSTGLQLQAFFVDTLSFTKAENGRMSISVAKWPMAQPLETWEVYETVMDRLGGSALGVLRISAEDLATATAAAAG